MDTLWKSASAQPPTAETPFSILSGYAERVAPDTANKFAGIVTETVREDTGNVTYSLYLVAPRLQHYMYKLFEVAILSLPEPYPATLRFFAKDPRNHRTLPCKDAAALRTNLEEAIGSTVTQNILAHLEQLMEIAGANAR